MVADQDGESDAIKENVGGEVTIFGPFITLLISLSLHLRDVFHALLIFPTLGLHVQ